MKKNPIYLCYKIVANRSDGTPGDDGDVHYRCLHGTHKVCTIKKLIRSNLNGVFFFYVAWPQTNIFLSTCELPSRPCQANVLTLFCLQRSAQACNTWWSSLCLWTKHQHSGKNDCDIFKVFCYFTTSKGQKSTMSWDLFYKKVKTW